MSRARPRSLLRSTAPFALLAALLLPASAGAAGTSTAAKAATPVNGGTGIPALSTHRRRRRTTRHRVTHHTTPRKRSRKHTTTAKRTTTSARTNTHNGITAPVKQDGGSRHLGERTLKPGMSGHDVRVLQGYLTLVGYPTTVDGDFGPTTEAHVIAFEAAHNLSADGQFTYADSLVLRQAVVLAVAGGALGKATINANGTASPPAGAPAIVQRVIAAANQIIDKPYIYAGGHSRWVDRGYDCSGAVSYALHGGGLLASPEDSTGFESYGSAGPGRWITIYADASHAFVVIAGIAFDTADYGGPNIPAGTGPRWRSDPTGNLADGGHYIVRHPTGL